MSLQLVERPMPGVLLLEPRVHHDDRGSFFEVWHRDRHAALGLPEHFAQDNLSYSRPGVLRGLHYQHPRAQGKLVTVLQGSVFDVTVDLRVGSPTFGRWAGVVLSGENHRQLYVPEGFAHGFLVREGPATFLYKCTDVYAPSDEGSIRWDDPDLGIDWPTPSAPTLSAKDAAAPRLRDVPHDRLPRFDGA